YCRTRKSRNISAARQMIMTVGCAVCVGLTLKFVIDHASRSAGSATNVHIRTIAFTLLIILTSIGISTLESFRTNGETSIEKSGQDPPTSTELTSAEFYQQKCAMCHDKPVGRVPARSQIATRSPDDIVQSLTTGSMKEWATGFSKAQITGLALYLTGKQPGATVRGTLNPNICKEPAVPISFSDPQWNGWGQDLENSRYQSTPGIRVEDVPRLKLKWAWTHPGPMATGQPTIIGNHLFVTTEVGQVYSLNAQTGCTYWSMNAGAGVRSAISAGPLPV